VRENKEKTKENYWRGEKSGFLGLAYYRTQRQPFSEECHIPKTTS
jgi:hypothetical protein